MLLKTNDSHSSPFWCTNLAHRTAIPPIANGNHVLPTKALGTSDLQQTSQELVAPTIVDASITVPSTSANIEEATSPAMSFDSTCAQHACDTQT
ncbi:hypothetical protein V6N13_016856 [Hibiscus sabdariffa]|uniref:Uncharacterized protein n=1 Tax=Hibiscus sabdariffa TaxID=183260 RepID=A0ABR2PV14_9ROSI